MVLEAIVARQRQALDDARGSRDEAGLAARAGRQQAPRDFRGAILAAPRPALVAECKRRSPVKGLLKEAYDPAAQAAAYARGGATAISVLTSPDFDGELAHLEAVRAAIDLPVLRKDFVLEPIQVLEARAAGADAILLIARVLDPGQLAELAGYARELGLQTLVEVHREAELDAALAAGPDLLGVNQRNLQTFDVDGGLFADIAPRLPSGLPMVAESGISDRAGLLAAGAAGAHAVLVGEALMRADDPEAAVRALLGTVG